MSSDDPHPPPAGAPVDPAGGGAVVGGDAAPPSSEASAGGPTSELSRAIASLVDDGKKTHERLLRAAADFENYKKRGRKEALEGTRRAEDQMLLAILPVLDNIDRALFHTEGTEGALVEGVRMVQKQFLAVLERYEVRPVETADKAFDPEIHEAIQQTHSERPAGIIVEELQKGFRRGERLLRPALVAVSMGAAPGADPGTAGEGPGEKSSDASSGGGAA
jgi:molecular chaperone GrpE